MLAMLGVAPQVFAGDFCSTFPEDPPGSGTHVIDGNDPATVQYFIDNNVTQITVDTNCTFRNWDPLTVTINFQTPATGLKPVYLIIFDNVHYTGNMACANIDHKIWLVNGTASDWSVKCQDLFIPVEAISKQVPAGKTTVGIGEAFTYSLIIPVLYDPASGTIISNTGTDVDVHSVLVKDDLNATGVDLTVVGTPTVTWVSNGSSVPHTYDNTSGLLTFAIDPGTVIPAGSQIRIDITVVPDSTNVVGTTFVNTASWQFGRVISLDPDGDGIFEDFFFEPLPGENGVSPPLTIGAPILAMDKHSQDTTLSPGGVGDFVLDVQNTGSTDAWDTTIVDRLPESGTASMCATNPDSITPVSAAIYEANGTTLVRTLTAGADFTVNYTGSPACELTLVTTGANAVIGPSQRLIINYQARLEPGATVNGEVLTNVAGATQWYSGDGSYPRTTFTGALTDGTPTDNTDSQDSFDVTVGLAGYYFQKTVSNRNSGANPATLAQAGDTLRYNLRVFNVNQNVNAVQITDQLDAGSFDFTTFSLVSAPAAANVSFNPVTGLLTIDGGAGSLDVAQGAELVVEFDITTLTTLQNNDVVSNQALLSSTSGNDVESDDPFVNGVDDPQDAIDEADPTVVVIQQPGSLAKGSGPPAAVIGETLTYTITVPAIPVAAPLYDVRILDTLGVDSTGVTTVADVVYVDAVATGGAWTLTNTGTASSPVIEDLGSGIDIPAGGQAVITLTARVDNTLTNQAGTQFYNAATYTYNRTNGVTSTQTAGGGVTTAAATTIHEPGIATFTKVADNTTPTPGQTVHYTVTMTAQSGANASDVFDVTLTDSLDPGLAYVPGSATVSSGAGVGSANAVFTTNVTGDGITTPQTLIWTVADATISIQAGDTITFEYDVLVLNNALPNQTMDNNIQAQWTSIDGISSYERTGVDGPPGPGVLNDYATPVASATLTVPDIVTTIDKVRSSDTYGAGDDDVRIGDIVEYTLTIPVPEGTLGNLQLVDTLPQGLDFLGVVSINGNTGPDPFVAVAPFVHADIPLANIVETGNPATGPTTVSWNLGDVTNPFGDGISDDYVIVYRAQVLNDDVLAQINSTPLNNTVTMSYDTAGGTVTDSDTDTVINVLQPDLTVNKTAAPGNGDVLIDAGEVITYTVDIVNSGAAPAYDTVLEDIIPAGLRGAGVTTLGITRHTTSSGALVATLATLAPAFDAATGTATWDFDTGVADAYSIPAGETLRIVYTVTADAGIAQGLVLTNAATATVYYSFDDEDVPAGAVSGDREIYGPTNTAGTTLYTGSPPVKVLDPVITEAPVGQEVVYHITVPGTVSGAPLYDVIISDTLDPALEYISATDVSGNGLSITDNTAGNNVSLGIGQIPAGQQAVIELRTRVANNASANAGTVVTNIAGYSYAYTPGGATQPALVSTVSGVDDTFTIVEPLLTINKTVGNVNNPGLPPVAGDVLRYTIDLPAGGGAPADNFSDAFDVTLIDSLGLGLAYQPGTATVNGTGNTISDPAIAGDGVATAQVLNWSLAGATADIDVVEGTSVSVSYDVLVLNGVLPGQSLTNSAVAQWTSLDGADANERDGSNTPAVNDYFTTPVTTSLTVPDNNAFVKTRLTDTYGAADASLRVGDIVDYQLSLTLQEGTTPDVVITDVLPRGLAFEAIVSINGDTTSPFGAVAPFSHADIIPSTSGDPRTGPSTLTLNIGDIVNAGDGNPANDDFVIIYRARVLNDVLAQLPNITLGNNAAFDYTTVSGPVTLNSSYSATLQQPVLTISKTATPANGDTVLDAGELVTYTVDISNSGAAPAYDTVLQDVIPVGLRNGAATITMVSNNLLSGTVYPPLTPTYDSTTGIAVWDFDSGVADTYTIPAGDTLRVVYQVQADPNLGAGLTMVNSAQVMLYYSFDDEAVPVLGSVVGVRQVYGPTAVATQTLTTAGPVALDKQITQATAAVGVPFTYRIVVPETPQTTALNDVRILDDLSGSAADLSFVSVSKVSGSQAWTPVNTGSATNLVIEDTVDGIDIPAGEQIEIDITVVLNNSTTNSPGLVFNNTADYTFNQVNGDVATRTSGLPDTSPDMTIVAPDGMTLEKSGPATLRTGIAGGFTLDIHNTGTAPAYDLTVTDLIPDPVPGGMCDTQPDNFVAQLALANGTPVGAPLSLGTDYSVNFTAGGATCTLTFTMITPAAAVPADNRLIITYDAYLDSDTANNTSLTNIAGVTEWFSGDTGGAGATGQIQTYTRTVTDGTPLVLDHEDAYTLLTELPVISVTKTVSNQTAQQSPATTATPGDTLRYEVTVTNVSPVAVNDYSLADEVDRLNALPMFVPGSMSIVSVPAGADTTNTNVNGGNGGTGLLDVRSLTLAAQGNAGDSVTVVFDITLAPSITSGTVVLNQAEVLVPNIGTLPSDDPNVNGPDDPNVIGDEDPTPITIISAPRLLVQKISDDITGSATDLQPGDTLRYTITVKNTGTEDMVNARLRDVVPANTSYVANSTTLNGSPLSDPAPGISPLDAGIPINAPGNTTAGYLQADSGATSANVATITFDVTINANVVGGTIISNQAFVNGDGSGSGPIVEKPSDDPATVTPDDPTLDVIGNLPLVDSQKTVALLVDNGTTGIVDSGDWLRYTITITNSGPAPATAVRLVDAVPADTTYLANTVFLNGIKVPLTDDGGVSPLIAGIDVSSSDLAPPVQGGGNGVLSPGGTATVIFDVEVNGGVSAGTIISNQGMVYTTEQPVEPTDADGNDTNGDQPTQIVVGGTQQLGITKQVTVVGGGTATAGGLLEYAVTVTNIGLTAATDVVVSDSLNLAQMSYVAGSATLNGSIAGTGYNPPVVSGDYSTSYGDLLPGQTATLRFRVQLDAGLAIGDVVQNTADVSWNAATQNASASASVIIGGSPGSSVLNGRVWHDSDFDNQFGAGEHALDGWDVQLYRNSVLLGTVLTDVNGVFSIPGVAPNDVSGDQYVLRFAAPGAGAGSAKLGLADSAFSNGLQVISDIIVVSNSGVPDLNLPIDPDGVVYNSITRDPIAGATVILQDATTGFALPQDCFDDPAQQNQVTLDGGYYKFDINFTQPECQAGQDYLISVIPPGTGYTAGLSVAIPPQTSASTGGYSVPFCTGDAVGTTPECEASVLGDAPPQTIPAGDPATDYYLRLTLGDGQLPADSQLFNNHIPIDPVLDQAVTISKVSSLVNVSRGELVPYTITVLNTLTAPLPDVTLIDNFPAGFKYVAGSARINGVPVEPVWDGLQLRWDLPSIDVNVRYTIKLLLVVGAGVKDGEYINRAWIYSNQTQSNASSVAAATVRVVPDPDFDCSDIIGKVFDDRNINGQQDAGESGIAGVRLATARGLLATTDEYGRFHITCASIPDEVRGSNFILKLDDRTLPSGYRLTTENPRVQRITRGKNIKFNFGATVHRVVNMDVADGAFEHGEVAIRPQWVSRLDLLLDELQKAPSVLRLTYLADVEDKGLVDRRMRELTAIVEQRWKALDSYRLVIEAEIYWRHGGPVREGGFE